MDLFQIRFRLHFLLDDVHLNLPTVVDVKVGFKIYEEKHEKVMTIKN